MANTGQQNKALWSKDLLLIVLDILKNHSQHGYAILSQLRQHHIQTFDGREGNIYKLLHELERDGILYAEWRVDASEGHQDTKSPTSHTSDPKQVSESKSEAHQVARKYYSLTSKGKRQLTSYTAEKMERQSVTAERLRGRTV
nr:helix-turn-helix transcriptional regulator [Caldalkalibacillus salinus]